MCRLFGFRSGVPSRVHESLVREQNSLRVQAREHQDGWGIAHYLGEEPEVAHGLGPAHGDPEFERVSSLVSSHAVLAHVRKASIGRVDLANAHPFVSGRWAFAHNGTVRDYQAHRLALEAEIAPGLRARLRGETDSERCFYLFLTRLGPHRAEEPHGVDEVARALAEMTLLVSRLTDRADGQEPTSMNFLVTDGRLMVGTRWNRTLFFSERKRRGDAPPDMPGKGSRLQQLVIASERLESEHHWHEVPERSMVGVDPELRLSLWNIREQ